MHPLQTIYLISILLVYCTSVKSQAPPLSPPDFTDLSGSCVKATYGNDGDPFEYTGLHPNRHALITSPGTDNYTNGKLLLLPANTSKVVRLGEARKGQSESISYRFVVDPEKTLLKVSLAIVMNEEKYMIEDGQRLDNSDFTIQTRDVSSQQEYACANFNLKNSHYSLPPEQSNAPRTPPWWREWSDVILDLTPFSGREVEVRFTKKAGNKYGWTYVYYTAACISAQLQMHDCAGNRFKLTAPEGYKGYGWTNGSKDATLSWQTGDSDMRLSCNVASRNTTNATYIASILLHGDNPESNRMISDTIQQGEAYRKNGFELGTFSKPGNYVYHQTFCDAETCSARAVYSLFLHVKQRYYPIEDRICEGEDYTANGFEWRKPAAGVYYDTLRLTSATGQDSIVCLKLSVSASTISPDRITGNLSPCCGVQESYTIPFSSISGGNFWQWEVPAGAQILSNSGNRNLEVVFTDGAQAGDIILHYSTGCTDGTITLRVTPQPSYQRFFTDTICSGNEYHKNNFHLPRQEEEGVGLYYQFHRTTAGCDSTLSLALTVLPSPKIKMLRSDSVLCEGDEVRLAVQNMANIPEEETGKYVAVGDIYCTDGCIIRPTEYATSGKTAEGVVFWVDKSGRHGWIVHKEESCEDCTFVIAENIPLPEGIGTDTGDMPTDTTGYSNTQKFWESGRINDYPAMRSVNFDKGWYIPAAKQFLVLLGSLFAVEPTLEAIGGSIVLPLDENSYVNQEHRFYYTSTQDEEGWMWSCERSQNNSTGQYLINLGPDENTKHAHVRPIRNF